MNRLERTTPLSASVLNLRFNAEALHWEAWSPKLTTKAWLSQTRLDGGPGLPVILEVRGFEAEAERILEEVCRWMLCERRQACGLCNSCLALEHSHHPHCFWLEARGQGSMDDLREAMESMQVAPRGAGGFYLWVLLGLEKLHPSAQQSLLKFLESPPAPTQCFLTAQALGSLPKTLVSRCQRWRLAATTELQAHLFQRTQAQDAATAQMICRYAAGSPEKWKVYQAPQASDELKSQARKLGEMLFSGQDRWAALQALLGSDLAETKQRLNLAACLLEDGLKTKSFLEQGAQGPLVDADLYFPHLQSNYAAWLRHKTYESCFQLWRRILQAQRSLHTTPHLNRNLLIQHCLGPGLNEEMA